jgi:hypothetical protein
MALGFGQVLSPSVKSVAAKQEAVNSGVAFQQRSNFLCKLRNVLAILEDGKDFPMLVRVDVAQTLEHLKSFESDSAIGGKNVRKQSAPQRMRMQYRASPTGVDDGKVNSRFRRGQPVPANDARRIVDFQELFRAERAFIQSCWRDRQAQRPLAHHRAEISTRSEHPSALVEAPPDLRESGSHNLKACARFFPAGVSRRFARVSVPGAIHGTDYRTLGLSTEFPQRHVEAPISLKLSSLGQATCSIKCACAPAIAAQLEKKWPQAIAGSGRGI